MPTKSLHIGKKKPKWGGEGGILAEYSQTQLKL